MLKRTLLIGLLTAIVMALPIVYGGICDQDFLKIKQEIIQKSKANWRATVGSSCVCPEDKNQFDKSCGLNSAWANRTSGEPKCYNSDIDIGDLRQFCPNITNTIRWDSYLANACCANHGGYCGCGGSAKLSYVICCDGHLATECNNCFTFGERFSAE